jgi:hypothetical protein
VFGGFAVLVALWLWTGGYKHADLRGIFLNAPAPLNNGNAYGPTIEPKTNTNSTNTTNTQQ